MTDINELQDLYDNAYDRGIYIKEFDEKEGYLAFAGYYHKLKAAGFDSNQKLDQMDLMQATLFMAPGYSEDSRVDSIQKSIVQMEEMERLGR